ncbi:MAG: DUF6273 domain-containing protein [Lachnospiraceae bacterium]|nr:DUF6273 domain-containing protein [Lachnospiraceae bacterium]
MKTHNRTIKTSITGMILILALILVSLEPISVNANTKQLKDVQIQKNFTMASGQLVTWDCIYFGSYPQSEITDNTTLYNDLVNATEWDSNNEIILAGEKYRRIKKSDATYATDNAANYYNWSNATAYHYFKYEPIKWRVLNVQNGQAFLVADEILDNQLYHAVDSSVTWATSTIRSWMNGYGSGSNQVGQDYTAKNFIDSAFTSAMQNVIINTSVKNSNNLTYGTNGGSTTTDKIFLLSEEEVYNTSQAVSYGFLKSKTVMDEGRQALGSNYAEAMGIYTNTGTGAGEWILRSPGSKVNYASSVSSEGNVETSGYTVSSGELGGMRPALKLNLSASNLYSYAGTVSSNGDSSSAAKSVANPVITKLKNQTITASSKTVAYKAKAFSLKAKANGGGKLSYKSSDENVAVVSSGGKVTVKNYGQTTITITAAAKGSYDSATKKITIKVVPKKMTLKKVTSTKKKRLTSQWTKDNSVTGYQMFLSTYKNFKKGTYERTYKASASKMNLTGLKSKKIYYVKIRAYKKVGTKNYFGPWSSTKKVKIK